MVKKSLQKKLRNNKFNTRGKGLTKYKNRQKGIKSLIKLRGEKTKKRKHIGGNLSEAVAIFELKTNMSLLPKGSEQNIYNIENGVNGVYLKKDKKKKKIYKTGPLTKQAILIGDLYGELQSIFIIPENRIRGIIEIVLKTPDYESRLNEIEDLLTHSIDICDTHNIVVIELEKAADKTLIWDPSKVNKIKDSKIYYSLINYRDEYVSRNNNERREWLIERIKNKDDPDIVDNIELRDKMLKSDKFSKYYQTFWKKFMKKYPHSDIEVNDRRPEVIRKSIEAENDIYNEIEINLSKLPGVINQIKSGIEPMLNSLKNVIQNIEKHNMDINEALDKEKSLCKFKKKFKSIDDVKNELLERETKLNDTLSKKEIEKVNLEEKKLSFPRELFNMLKQIDKELKEEFGDTFSSLDETITDKLQGSGSIGTKFERYVEQNPDLQQVICDTAGIKYENKSYFDGTWGDSDIDMAIM